MEEFFKEFTGPQWTTFVMSVLALGVSVYTLYRNRTPQPGWEFVSFTEELFKTYDESGLIEDDAQGLAAVFRQTGPGVAESVKKLDVRLNRDVPVSMQNTTVKRGETIRVLLTTELEPGDYPVRIRYRCLPNTRKVREFRTTVRVTTQDLYQVFAS